MKLFKLLAAALCLSAAVAAHAQLGVYGMYSATSYTGITCLDPSGHCSSGNNKVSPSGGSGGVYYDFKTLGPVRLGFDARAGESHANKSAVSAAGGDNITHTTTALGGVRGSFKTPVSFLRPYAQVSAGWARSNATEPCQVVNNLCTVVPYDNFIQYEAFGGLDIHVFPLLDLRAIELGIGNMNRIGSGVTAGTTSSVGVRSIGAGIVFHLPIP